MTQVIFDGGVFVISILIAFACMVLYRKIGAVILVVSVIAFLISGLVAVTGEDVAFYNQTNPVNETINVKNLTSGSITQTTFHSITPSNQTSYLIGNGQFPITGTGQLLLGSIFFLLAIVCGVIFLDQSIKGRLVLGD